MTGWNENDLNRLAAANELRIAAFRIDGTLRPEVPVWVVRAGDDIIVRSWKGRDGAWFPHANASGTASIRAAGVTRKVRIEVAEPSKRSLIDAAYRAKYGRGMYVDAMVTDEAASTSVLLVPLP